MRTKLSPTWAMLAAAALALFFFPGVGAAEKGYEEAIVAGIVTDGGSGPNDFTLPAGAAFPQLTSPDQVFETDATCHVVTGSAVQFTLAVGVDYFQSSDGNMRLTTIYTDGEALLVLGTFTMQVPGETYAVSGTVAGDAHALYLAGVDTGGTPGTEDDRPFLLRANVHPPDFLLGEGNGFFGNAGVLIGDPLVQGVEDHLSAGRDAAGSAADLGSFTAPFTFNQFTPPDGSGDLTVGVDSTAQFLAGLGYSGRMEGTGAAPLAGDFSTSLNVLALTSGPSSGSAISLGSFEIRTDDGRFLEGIMVGDAGSPDATGIPVDGYMFSLAAPRGSANEYFFGSYSGYLDGPGMDPLSHLGVDLRGDFWSVDSAPPGLVFEDHEGPLVAGAWNEAATLFRDMNGSTDIKTVLYSLGASRTSQRLRAKYDHVRGRLYLYNSRLSAWVGGCAPGSAGTVRTPVARLSCANTMVGDIGEYLYISWSLMPMGRLAGTWNNYLKVVDRGNLAEGPKLVRDTVEVLVP